MTAAADAIARLVLMAGWGVLGLLLVVARMRARRGSAGEGATRKRDLQSWAGLALQGLGFAFAWGVGRERGAAFWPAGGQGVALAIDAIVVALTVSSVIFAGAALRTLDKQWSLTARVRDDHELIQHGPFARVRHPIYTALLGLLVATALCQAAPWAIAVAVLVYLAGTHWRARREEALLAEMFGPAYAAYRARVPLLLPRISRRA